jgi:hypothetical protein
MRSTANFGQNMIEGQKLKCGVRNGILLNTCFAQLEKKWFKTRVGRTRGRFVFLNDLTVCLEGHHSKPLFTLFLLPTPYRSFSRVDLIRISEGSNCILFFEALIGDLLASVG